MHLARAAAVTKLRLEDWLRTSNGAGYWALRRLPSAYIAPLQSARLEAAATLAAYFPYGRLGKRLLRQAHATAAGLTSECHSRTARLSRSLVLKPYCSEKEPGLLLVHFEDQLSKLVKLSCFAEFQREYRVLFMATWQPFYSEPVFRLAARAEAPFFLLPSAFSESHLVGAFSPQCHALPFHSASWVRSDLYPVPGPRSIDLLMIANFARHKRHWRLFEALRSLPESLRVVVAGVPMGSRTRDSLRTEADLFGVRDRVSIIEKASDEELRRLLNQSRLLCAMTHKEGAYVAVAEALMAGVPVAMFRNAIVGTKAYINEQTGFLLDESAPLAPQLAAALEAADSRRPQEWAASSISAEINCRALNERLREWMLARTYAWTQDIEPFYCERFDFHYFRGDADAALAPEYARLAARFGIEVERRSPGNRS